MAFWRAGTEGVSVAVKVQPRARRPGLQGRAPGSDGEALRIGVAEPAEDGRANTATCALIAEVLHVPTSAVTVMRGATSRQKVLLVAGDTARIVARLETL